ncbi:MAG: LytTR family DNA-binding domain-containing protein [Peptostreptococcaceae bacterium]|nr:LytTR family DNA-binding domain-containing protein [Peptostreptococcaceae bacterium]
MFRIAICDDVPGVCEELEKIILRIEEELPDQIHIRRFYTGEDLLRDIREKGPYQLIFLDIELGMIDGLEIGHILREEMEDYLTKIIYISSKSIYDRQLFDVQPFHFLQKPLDEEKVIHDLHLAMKIFYKENKIFEFYSQQQRFRIPFREILYFESEGRKIKLVGIREKHLFYETFDRLLKILPDFFVQPHRSYIVNYELVTRFTPDELYMPNRDRIPISRGRKKAVRDFQMSYEKKRLK